MSKYIYITTVAGGIKNFRLDTTYIDLCRVYTNKAKAIKAAQKRSSKSSYFELSAVYCAELLPYGIGYDYPTLIAAYKEGKEIDINKDAQ